ncbi:DNA-binding transcriptional regulator, CsgD family [Paracoccus thiocyanatus]|uniref:DNA-binding transcriptional regulator, CsgD family n=1 Tax=Paracoccus thiocyanatus TaxID=34006 RepID=A0A1N6YW29_9RHOB|nr:LuxR family transcriptional regulator [Paracoccus thiocyanatus]SIR18762.1 DNA-binding transcriptional regulator, CsgD family [Paracoccus thiocyanatus]
MQNCGLFDPDAAADLLGARDNQLFATRLLEIANSTAGIEELFAYRVGDDVPRILASASRLGDVAERARAYARRFHHSDPVAQARRATRPGNGFACRIPAQAISLGAYRSLCFDRPRFAEKICFGWCRADHALVVTFYQRRDAAEPDMAQLGALAQLAMTGLTRLAQSPAPLLAEVQDRLAQAYPVLTAREREICARTIAGQTARAIGEELALGVSTVLTYRQRAYQKLGISKSNDLLAAIMH